MVQGSSLIRPRTVTGDGEGLVSHAGVAWLAETADASGLTAGSSEAMAALPQRRHDPGRALAQMILALADGTTCLSDIATLRSQPAMFGRVASEATLWRTFDQIGAGPTGDDLIVDFDATLINTKADKQDARPNYKRGYGHHPLLAMIADTDEVLAGILRPGQRRVEHRHRSRHRAGRRAGSAPHRVASRPPRRRRPRRRRPSGADPCRCWRSVAVARRGMLRAERGVLVRVPHRSSRP